jgi:hypothetical protein
MTTIKRIIVALAILALALSGCQYGGWSPTAPTPIVAPTQISSGSPQQLPTALPPAASGFLVDLTTASQTLGIPSDRLEFTADCCGIHVIEDHDRTTINVPSGAVAEGYWDMEPGKSPSVQIVVGPAMVRWQGGTIWWPKADETTLSIACFLWDHHSTNGIIVSQGAVNFDPSSCH